MRLENRSLDLLDYEGNLVDEDGHKRSISGVGQQGIGYTLSQAVPECYLNPRECVLECQLWIRLTGLYDANYIVVLDWFGIHENELLPKTGIRNKRDSIHCYTGSSHLKKSMLVGIVKSLQDSKGRGNNGVRPIVGLKSFDCVNEGAAETLQLPFTFSPKLRFRVSDNEVIPVYIGGRHFSRFEFSGHVNQVIQGTPKVVDAVCDNECPSQEIGLGLVEMNDETDAGFVSATFDGERVVASICPSCYLSVDSFEMFFSAA